MPLACPEGRSLPGMAGQEWPWSRALHAEPAHRDFTLSRAMERQTLVEISALPLAAQPKQVTLLLHASVYPPSNVCDCSNFPAGAGVKIEREDINSLQHLLRPCGCCFLSSDL